MGTHLRLDIRTSYLSSSPMVVVSWGDSARFSCKKLRFYVKSWGFDVKSLKKYMLHVFWDFTSNPCPTLIEYLLTTFNNFQPHFVTKLRSHVTYFLLAKVNIILTFQCKKRHYFQRWLVWKNSRTVGYAKTCRDKVTANHLRPFACGASFKPILKPLSTLRRPPLRLSSLFGRSRSLPLI